MKNVKGTFGVGLAALVALVLLLSTSVILAAEDDHEAEDEIDVVLGGQDVDLDADEAGEAQFRKYQDYPSGLVLNYFNWNHVSANNYFQVEVRDATQDDERFVLNAGYGPEWKIRGGSLRCIGCTAATIGWEQISRYRR